jgi:hypothetical protein
MIGFCAAAVTVAKKNIENNFSFMFEVSSFKNPFLLPLGEARRGIT